MDYLLNVNRGYRVQLGRRVVVIGGGNFWRGNDPYAQMIERATADYMGMLGTMMNALELMDALERASVFTRVMSAIEMRAIAEP